MHKSLQGEITIPGMIKYLERYGYNTVFFNTEEGDHLLRAYDLYPCKTKAITYSGNTKVVFVDGDIHASDMLYALLHECGHIVFRHLDDMIDKRRYECEAEAFAYAALHYHSRSFARKMRTALFAAWDSVISFFSREEERKPCAEESTRGNTEANPCKGISYIPKKKKRRKNGEMRKEQRTNG